MAGSVKGLLVEIGGDTSGLQKALKKVNSESSSLSKELKGINSLLKLDPKNTELLAQKQTVLTSNIKETEEKLNLLKQAQKEADETIKNGGEISQENYRNLQREIISTENKLKNLNKEYKNFLTETSKLTQVGKAMQEFGDKVEKGSKKISELGSNITSKATTGVIGLGTVAITTAASLEEATDKYIAKAGKSVEETEKYKKVLTDINDADFGEGYEDIANSMAIVEQQMRGLDDAADLENITKKAYYLKDAFDAEVNESVRAAKMMMEQWGVSADEAFELINQGYQKGLDKNGDFLDSINEYSVHFRQIGLSATDMFNTFSLGAKSGAFSIDKVGDAIKEMGIRLKDGSVTDTLKSMKLNAKDLEKAFAEGGEKGSAAFGKIVEGLQNIKDPLKQNQAGVAIFGTMWEDLGKDAVFSMTSYSEEFDETMDSMNTSMENMYGNTKNETEASLKRIKTVVANLGTKLLPIAEKVLDKVDNFIDKLDNLSDSEQENIIKIGLIVAGIGPLIKILGTAGNVISTTTKGIGKITEAIGKMTSKSSNATSALNSVKGAAGVVAGAIGLATLAYEAHEAAMDQIEQSYMDTASEMYNLKSATDEMKSSRDNLNESLQKSLDTNLTELDQVQNLKDELDTLVDKNGKVKKGYENRASYIVNELKNATGVEIELTNGVIKKYDELSESIEKTITKQRATDILENLKQKFNNSSTTLEENKTAYDSAIVELTKAQERLTELENGIAGKLTDGIMKYSVFGEEAKKAIETQKQIVADAKSNAETRKKLYEEDLENTAEYNYNLELYSKGTEEAYQEMYDRAVYNTTGIANGTIESLNQILSASERNLIYYRDKFKETSDESYLYQIEQEEKMLAKQAEMLIGMTSATDGNSEQVVNAWKTLANTSYEEYCNAIAPLDETMQAKIQEMTGVIAGGTPQMQAIAKDLGEKTVAEFDQSAEAKQKALNTITEYLNGLTDEEQREFLKQAGIENADIVMQELDQKTLSEENGKNILQGLYNGLQNKSWKDKIVGVASGLAQAVNKAFTGKTGWDIHSPSKKMQEYVEYYVQPIEDVMNKRKSEITSTASNLAQTVNAKMLDGLNIPNYAKLQSNLANKMMNTTNTKNSYNIELKFYPQKMTETELNNAFKFLNRKLGKLY